MIYLVDVYITPGIQYIDNIAMGIDGRAHLRSLIVMIRLLIEIKYKS